MKRKSSQSRRKSELTHAIVLTQAPALLQSVLQSCRISASFSLSTAYSYSLSSAFIE